MKWHFFASTPFTHLIVRPSLVRPDFVPNLCSFDLLARLKLTIPFKFFFKCVSFIPILSERPVIVVLQHVNHLAVG